MTADSLHEILLSGALPDENSLLFKVPDTDSPHIKLINYSSTKLFHVLGVYEGIIIMWDMQNEPFKIENIYKISIENVWKAITCSTEMKQWYFDVPGFRAEPGFEFHFLSSSDEEREYRHQCQVTEVKALKKLAFTWQYSHYDAVTLVTIELFSEPDGGTRLMLTHEGLEAYPDNDPDFSKESFSEGWTWLINCALKEYLEKTYRPAGRKIKLEVSL